MTIDRRRMLGLAALGFGAGGLQACASSPFAGLGNHSSGADVERTLIELDQVLDRLEAHDAIPRRLGIRALGPEVEAGRQRSLLLLRTMCFLGSYRDVPPDVWQEPRVAAHLDRTLPRIQATLGATYDQLAGLDEAHVARIDDRLAREPDLPMRIMESIDEQATELGVPLEHRMYLRVSTAELAQRYRRDGAREATRRITATYGRMLDTRLAELGVDPAAPDKDDDDARAEVARGPTWPVASLLAAPKAETRGEKDESCVVDEDCRADLACRTGVCAEPRKSKQLMRTARKVAIAGAWAMIPPACGVGVLILLHALFIVIVAGIVHAGEE